MTSTASNTESATANFDAVRAELVPTGILRLGIVAAPAPSALFAVFDVDSQFFRGVTVDLGKALAGRLSVPLEIVNFPNSGACMQALAAGTLDVSFMPVDAERQKHVAFGPAYYNLESTYLVTAASGISNLANVDRPGVRVVDIANTTTIRSAARSLKRKQPEAAETIAEAVSRLAEGRAEALALSRDAFQTLLPQLPGASVLDGGFQQTGIAIAVCKDKPAALAFAGDFLEHAKANGLVRKALDAVGLSGELVAPPAG